MKKSEQTAVKTDLPETKGTVVLLTSVKEAEAVPKTKGRPGRKPKAEAVPETEKPTPKTKEAGSKTEVKPKKGRKLKAESGSKTEKPTPQKSEAGSGTEVKPKAEADPKTETPTPQKAEPATTDKKTGDIPKVEPESAPAPDMPKEEPLPPLPAPAPDTPKEEPLPPPPAPAPAPLAVNPPVSVVESPLKLMKQEFTRRSNRIRKEMCNIQNSFVVIGFQLHWIKANNMYRVLNYKNICEYAEKEYNIKKSTCNNLISIIENFAERDENGEVIESITECYRNYSSTQLLAMIGMPEELQQQVTPDMSVRAIQRLRKGEPEKPPVDAEKATVTDVKEPVKPPEPVKEKTAAACAAPMTGANPHTETPVSSSPQIGAEMPPQETEKGPDKDSGMVDKDTADVKSNAAVPVPHPVNPAGPPEQTVQTEESKDIDADKDSAVDKDTAGNKDADADKNAAADKNINADKDTDTAESNTGVPVSHPVKPKEPPEQNTHAEEPDGKDTVKLAEIDSYSTYKEMLGKLDIMMKHVFSGGGPVRVKIICVHG